ncbi:HFL198Wp [Eremothecium sinecaudum]|uniref:HFL198Wp n=1 Tax=Eremothecium sinecaudum TaxID=45286 RepID=A0A109UZV9_9SACH|nr:HFL198Wp [Eremothecium sinecaudum]AMD21658.1 HFL198Wp [Eremothecium sinecaudum]
MSKQPIPRHIAHPATRDLPYSFRELVTGWIVHSRKEITIGKGRKAAVAQEMNLVEPPAYPGISTSHAEVTSAELAGSLDSDGREKPEDESQNKWWAIAVTGTGLFSDGYVNSSIGLASTMLAKIYGDQYSKSQAISYITSISFAGTVLGQLSFGYFADRYGRRGSMLVGTLLLIFFTIMTAGAWGVGTSDTNPGGLFEALAVYRFFVGIAIGSEYSTASPAAAEASNAMPVGKRNRYFCLFTNAMIDLGIVLASVVPWVLVNIASERRLTLVWRLTLGLGAVPPLLLFYMRTKYRECEEFRKMRFRNTAPYWRVIKFYWFRLSVISLVWFFYDVSSYSFGTYSSYVVYTITGDNASFAVIFAWNILLNCFYMPGAFLGAIFADYLGPRLTLSLGVGLQTIIGFLMTVFLDGLKKQIAAFVVILGIFLTLGEFGPGDNLGLLASKTVAAPIRGQFYGVAAAVGKVGAFAGAYAFPKLMESAGGRETTRGLQAPFWVSSALCLVSTILTLVFVPPVHQEAVSEEDIKFLEYLESTGYDMTTMGEITVNDSESVFISDTQSASRTAEKKEPVTHVT